MNSDFLLVHRSILPDSFPLVIATRQLVEKEGLSVSEACKKTGVSRSVYYKYKDLVFAPAGGLSKKAILSFKSEDVPGVLSSILGALSRKGANVLTISQDMPISGLAYITMMINTASLSVPLLDLLKEISSLPHLLKAEVLAYE